MDKQEVSWHDEKRTATSKNWRGRWYQLFVVFYIWFCDFISNLLESDGVIDEGRTEKKRMPQTLAKLFGISLYDRT